MKQKVFILLVGLGFLGLLYGVSIRQAILWLIGIGYGATLRGYQFGFTTGWRRLIEKPVQQLGHNQRDYSGLKSQILLILLLYVFSVPLIILFPQVSSANASISVSLLIGAFAFGLLMQLADGCGSGTLFKAGSLRWVNIIVLIGFIGGAFWGSVDIVYWLNLGILLPAINFITMEGLGRLGMFIPFVVLVVFYLWLRWQSSNSQIKKTINTDRGAILLAGLALLNLIIAGQPWGIVYGLGLWGAKISQGIGVFDPATTIYWQESYPAQSLISPLISDVTSITNIGLIFGSLGVSFILENEKNNNKDRQIIKNQTIHPINKLFKVLLILVIGIALGYSSRLAFGCNIGALVGGISTGSLHGWVWLIMAFGGSIVGVRLRKLHIIRSLHGI